MSRRSSWGVGVLRHEATNEVRTAAPRLVVAVLVSRSGPHPAPVWVARGRPRCGIAASTRILGWPIVVLARRRHGEVDRYRLEPMACSLRSRPSNRDGGGVVLEGGVRGRTLPEGRR